MSPGPFDHMSFYFFYIFHNCWWRGYPWLNSLFNSCLLNNLFYKHHSLHIFLLSYIILLVKACGLPLRGPRLRPVPGIRRLGACSSLPFIMIRGPNLVHPLLMILSSAAIVCSWPGDA